MKIYEFDGFPNPARVRIALAEKGLTDQVEFISVNVPEGEHKRPEFLAKNPSGAVPVLELEDGTTISECTAITEYLDHVSGESALTGHTPKERATIHMMQRLAEANLLDAVSAYFHHATPALARISRLISVPNGAPISANAPSLACDPSTAFLQANLTWPGISSAWPTSPPLPVWRSPTLLRSPFPRNAKI